MRIFKASIFLLLQTIGVYFSPAYAVEPQPGKVYTGGTEINAASLGVRFTIPGNWKGALSPDGQSFLMEPPGQTATMFVIADKMSANQAYTNMQGPVPLTDTVQLVLNGQVKRNGKTLSAKYSVSYNPNLIAEARARTGGNGTSIAFFLVSNASDMKSHRAQLDKTFESLDLQKVAVAQQTAGASSSNAKDTWLAYLKGKHIVRFFTTSGYTEEQHIWLCSNGQYVRRFDGGGFGGGASGAFQGNYDGTWTATGKGEHGQLLLNSANGQSVYNLRWDYDNNRLHVDGKRWLHDDNKVCN
jgi:hypothetical protein